MISIIAAVGDGGVIGVDGGMPWHIPEDLRRFRELTMGGTVIMGRRTWESLPRPLDGRRVIVLTHNALDNVETASSLEEALSLAGENVFIAGGGEVYREALPLADRLYITRIEGVHEGDTFFPPINAREWCIVAREPHKGFEFQEYNRIFTP